MKGIQTFFKLFYGIEFYRYFTRPPDFPPSQGFRIQYPVKSAKELYLHVHQNSGFHPCYISIYDYGSQDNLNKKNHDKMVFDRAFFDFDITNHQVQEVKGELINLRTQGLYYHWEKQEKLREKLRTLIIDDRVAEPSINEAKRFASYFNGWFGSYPILFFSGLKGCHAYTFFEPVRVDINRVLSWFGGEVKKVGGFTTLDLSPCKTAGTRLSRAPYTRHQYTDLTVVPFTINDTYEEILEKALDPRVGSFSREGYYSGFGEYLQEIDPILKQNQEIKRKREQRIQSREGQYNPNNRGGKVGDHRRWFRGLLGPPAYESPTKPYVMYHCPFPDHPDHHPSFKVHPRGYWCYGCGRHGNYWQFLKDYYGWTDEQVKEQLKRSYKKKRM